VKTETEICKHFRCKEQNTWWASMWYTQKYANP
jgi:hypothetical protein